MQTAERPYPAPGVAAHPGAVTANVVVLGGGTGGTLVASRLRRALQTEQLDVPPDPEFLEMISDSGAGLYACRASVELSDLTKDDLIDQVKDTITVGEFHDLAAGRQILFR